MNIRNLSSKLLGVALLASLSGASFAYTSTDTFTATADLEAALTVDCATGVSFGLIVYRAANAAGVVTVAATAGGAVSSTSADVIPLSGSNSAACAIANEGSDGVPTDATAALSATGATFAGSTLSNVVLTDATVNTLTATLTLSKVTAIGDETIYVGGDLSVPASFAFPGAYTSGTVTLTVTD